VNIAEALAHHARSKPDKPAIVAAQRTILYRDLDTLVRRFAAHLIALGVREGDTLGIALRDTPEHLLALYAAARMGALALPMDWRWTVAERAAIATHFSATLLLAEPDAEPIAGVPNVALDHAFMAAVAAAPSDTPVPADSASLRLVLSLSSGTTGRPKGPAITHAQFVRRMWTHWIDLGLNADQTYVSATPLYFGGGRTFAVSQLFAGATVVLFPPPWQPEDFLAELAKRNATAAFLVPTQLRRLLELPDTMLAPIRALRLLLSSGAPLFPHERLAIRDRLCAGFCEYYASTEGGGVSLLRPADIDAHGDSVGRPVFGVEVAILDADGAPLPPGAEGRLAYRGPGVAIGFHNDAEASREAFVDGWFLPGDLAVQDTQGFVTLRGRAKDMIIRAGVNIHPAEIEAVLLADPRVADAAVVGWPSAARGEEVAAFVVASAAVREDELLAACRARLAPYKVPGAVFFRDSLPRNSAGKVLKPRLVEELPAR
jgi:acyl-CoA synthetase (AMP-forming)/AMP-acid ligase II